MVNIVNIGPTESQKLIETLEMSPVALVAVTNPNCHHCDIFKPIFNELCNNLKNDSNNNLTILKVHSDNVSKVINQRPEFKLVDGVPTLFITKFNSKPIVYQGDNDYDSLENFVKLTKQTGGRSKKKKTKKKIRKNNKTKKYRVKNKYR